MDVVSHFPISTYTRTPNQRKSRLHLHAGLVGLVTNFKQLNDLSN